MLLDEERQQRVKAYYKTRVNIGNVLGCIVGACIGGYIGFVYFWPIPLPLSMRPIFPFQFVATYRLAFPFLNWEPVHDWFPWLVLFYYGICALIFAVCYVLSDWFNRALLPNLYGLDQPVWKRFLDIVWRQFVLVVSNAILVEVIYLLAALQPNLWWLEVALLLGIFNFCLTSLLPWSLWPFHSFWRLETGPLPQQLVEFTAQASTKIAGIIVIDSLFKSLGAEMMLLGWGSRSYVAITQKMAYIFPIQELEAFLAVAVGHRKRSTTIRVFVMNCFYESVCLLLLFGLANLAYGSLFSLQGVEGAANVPLFLVLCWASLSLEKNYFSRFWGDNILQVDEVALQLTSNVAAFSDILIHLANTELAVFDGQGKGSPKNRIRHVETLMKGEVPSTLTPEGTVSLDN